MLFAIGLLQPACGGDECLVTSDCTSTELCQSGSCMPKSNGGGPRIDLPAPIWEGAETGFLWRIEGDAPTYLLGTLHSGIDPAGFPQAVWGALDSREVLVTEVDLEAPIDQATFDRYVLLPRELALDSLLPADVWEGVVRNLSGQLSASTLRRLEPWYVSLIFNNAAHRDDPSMEPVLVARAKRMNKARRGLETVDEHLEVIWRVPRSVFIDDLTAAVRDPEGSRLAVSQVVSAYVHADAAKLRAILDATDPAFNTILLRERNERWIPQILSWHQNGEAFIAVGAGHLVGSDNVIDMLRARGSTVTPVRFDGQALRAAPLSIERIPRERSSPLPLYPRPWL
jgi:uncharacterized protein